MSAKAVHSHQERAFSFRTAKHWGYSLVTDPDLSFRELIHTSASFPRSKKKVWISLVPRVKPVSFHTGLRVGLRDL